MNASNARTGYLIALAAVAPEIILLDIGLPIMNGYEVARRIRRTPHGRGATLVAVTGWGQEEDTPAREAGFDGHVTKPVDHGQLLEILRGERITPRMG